MLNTNSPFSFFRCVVGGLPFFVTVIPPVAVVLLANVLALFIIAYTSNKSSSRYKHNAISKSGRVRIIVAFVLLFGITWTFGFLVVANAIIAFQYIFCILSMVS